MSLLIEAIRQSRYKKIQLALELGWDLNERDPEKLRTPLIGLTFLEREIIAARLCKRFLRAGARPDLKDISGRNALHWACVNGREKLAEIFVNNWEEYDINERDCQGNTALSLAVISSNEKIVQKLITFLNRYRLNVDVPNNNGETPLILASRSRSYFLCDILAKSGKASTEMRDKIKQLNAKEWESLTDPIMRSISPGVNRKTSRQKTPELLPKVLSSGQKSTENNYKDEIYKIFAVQYDELSSSFRQSAIPPPKKEESDSSAISACYENENYWSEFSSGELVTCSLTSFRGGKRFSISKAAQVPIGVHRLRKSRNTEPERNQNSWMSAQEQYNKSNSRKYVIPKLELSKIAPVAKRNSCPVFRQNQVLNSKWQMGKFKLEPLTENVECDP